MSHDVHYRSDAQHRSFRPVAEGRELLLALGFRASGERTFHLEELVEAHLAVVDDEGEALHADEANRRDAFNRLDTHVPWAVLESPALARRVTLTRIAIARRLGWSAVDMQFGVDVAGPVDASSHARFEPADGGLPTFKGGIAMDVDGEQRARPKGVISARDPALAIMSLVHDESGRLIIGRGTGSVRGRLRIELRDDAASDAVWTTESGGAVLAVHHDGRTIAASGTCYDGYQSNLVVFDQRFDHGAEVRRAIACPPFAWLGPTGRMLLARVPRKESADGARIELARTGAVSPVDPGAELVVGGAEKCLRTYPLLADEAGPVAADE